MKPDCMTYQDYGNPAHESSTKWDIESHEVACFLKDGEGIATVIVKIKTSGAYTVLDEIDLGFNDPTLFDCIEDDVMDWLWSNYNKDYLEINVKF